MTEIERQMAAALDDYINNRHAENREPAVAAMKIFVALAYQDRKTAKLVWENKLPDLPLLIQ